MSEIDFDIVREMLRSRMERRGLTFTEMGAAIGISRSTIANFVLGLTQEPKAMALNKYLAWLAMPAERFIATKTDTATMEKVESALLDDPALSPEGARELSDLMRAAYSAVTHQSNTAGRAA